MIIRSDKRGKNINLNKLRLSETPSSVKTILHLPISKTPDITNDQSLCLFSSLSSSFSLTIFIFFPLTISNLRFPFLCSLSLLTKQIDFRNQTKIQIVKKIFSNNSYTAAELEPPIRGGGGGTF